MTPAQIEEFKQVLHDAYREDSDSNISEGKRSFFGEIGQNDTLIGNFVHKYGLQKEMEIA
jgi:hypothetical protein